MKKSLALTAALALALTTLPALAAPNPAAAQKMLSDAAHHGDVLFSHATFGGHRKFGGAPATCESCHLGGGLVAGRLPNGKAIPSLKNAAAIFPRYNPKAGKVVTLAGQIQHCIQGGLGGKAPAAGSRDLVDMEVYLASIAHGERMNAGGPPR